MIIDVIKDVFKDLNLGVCVMSEGNIAWYNKKLLNMSGYTTDEFEISFYIYDNKR